jgi:hypothetical protein
MDSLTKLLAADLKLEDVGTTVWKIESLES